MRFEGGFQGRTNKLVDGCYSFWQAAIIPIVQALMSMESELFSDIPNRLSDVKNRICSTKSVPFAKKAVIPC